MKNLIALCTGVALLLVLSGAHAAVQAPDALVRDTVQEVLTIIKQDKDIQTGNQKKLLELVDGKVLPHFDFERMTRLAVGKGWRNATPEQRTTLASEFRTLLVRTYTNSFTRYRDQMVEVKPVKMPAGADEVTVSTVISKPGTQSITVDYEMEQTPTGWKVFDLTVEGVSLVTNYRSTFSEQMQQGGIDRLIKTLVEKNRGLAAK